MAEIVRCAKCHAVIGLQMTDGSIEIRHKPSQRHTIIMPGSSVFDACMGWRRDVRQHCGHINHIAAVQAEAVATRRINAVA